MLGFTSFYPTYSLVVSHERRSRMSFIITAITQEGIVMASDSRLTINNIRDVNGTQVTDVGVSQSDTNYKTFLTTGGSGISTFGTATVHGVPLSGYLDAFILEKTTPTTSVEDIPGLLIAQMQSLPEVPDAGFSYRWLYSKGWEEGVLCVSRVFSKTGQIDNVVPSQQPKGVIWDGEPDIMVRILNPNLFIRKPDGQFEPLPNFGIPFDMFTLQDAIDFAVYAVRATSDTMHFQLRYKTVGGPIDVLIVKPDHSEWLHRKALHLDT
jgi:hypothetical protein